MTNFIRYSLRQSARTSRRVCFGPLLVSFLLGLLLVAQPGHAQDVSTYQLAASSGTFVPIAGGANVVRLPVVEQNSGISAGIATNFSPATPFYYGGTAISTIKITSDGYLDLYGYTSTYSNNSLSSNSFIAPLWDDLDGTGGTASYVLAGTAPNRVLTFEWLNWRWPASATVANISFQVKLYESTNVIQFVYRPEAGAFINGNTSASIGFDGSGYYVGDNNSYRNFISLTDASAAPVLVNNQVAASFNAINNRPTAGQTYTFTPTNDYCGHATPLTYGSTVVGSTLTASQQNDPRGTCSVGGTGSPSSSPGIFYSLLGNGQTVTVSTCAGTTATGGDTKLFVYSGSCGNFTCVGNNDDVVTGGCGTNPLASAVTFATQNGTMYYVFVQYKQAGTSGPIGLRVSATGLATRSALGAGALALFPNPAHQALTLRLPALPGERTAQLTLLNSLGQAVQARTLELRPSGTSAELDVSALAAGLYTVRVQAGSQVAAQQVVVE